MLSAKMAKIITLVTTCLLLSSTSAAAVKNSTGGFSALLDYVDSHNTKRSLHQDTPNLGYSAEMEGYARNAASRCIFEHTRSGENIYALFGGNAPSFSDAINSWYAEISKYDYNNPVFGMATGHFTQVVWKSTANVGCASNYCQNMRINNEYRAGYIIYCNYDPPGNYPNQFRNNVLPLKGNAPNPGTCRERYVVESGDYCFAIWSKFGLSESEFYELNPGIDCSKLQVGQSVCVGKTIANCSGYYTVRSGDSCYAIATQNGLSLQQFYNLNPGLNCDNLQINQRVCIRQ
ncbi:sterol-binding protein [Basidiobolus ranarum]|uniref:Sterol-binding protein n=1 Tax=Basidiobolus ranarum TaxID=34480 RepID=A0ABR2WVT1_9FUNG